MTSTPKLIIGEKYEAHGLRTRVTGWLVRRPNLNGRSADSLVPVTLLTDEGEKVRNVLVRVIDVIGTEPRNFSHFTDHMLWRVAETDMGGLGEHALAELTYRERVLREYKAAEESARIAASRRSADVLMGRV